MCAVVGVLSVDVSRNMSHRVFKTLHQNYFRLTLECH